MLASAAAFTDNPEAPAAARSVDGGSRVVVPLFLATVFLFFVTYQLFGVAAAAVVMVLFCAFALAARNVTVTRGFPFLRRLSLGVGGEEGRSGIGGGGGVGGVARAAAGMDAAAIMALPAAFGYKRDPAAAATGWAQCAICLGLVRVGEAVRRLPSCGHLFHAGCVDEWLCAHATCPLCRAAVCAAAPELPV